MSFTHRKKIKQGLKVLLLVLIGTYVLTGAMLYFIQEQILFQPTKLQQDYVYNFNHPFDELFLKAADGAVINAIHFKAENSKGVMLYFHGNAGDLSRWGEIVEYFVAKDYDVLVMDYRTFGKSKGELGEQLMYNDAQMCYQYLNELYKEDSITIYGRSLGGSFATYVAAKNNPKQLILEAPFYNVQDVANNRFPLFPTSSLLKYKFLNNEYIKMVRCKITILHGTEDMVVPFASGEKLFNAAPKDNSNLLIIDSGRHNNLMRFEEYHNRVNMLLP